MRQRHCRVCGGWHRLDENWPAECMGHYGYAPEPTHGVIADEMPAMRHPITQELYDSKSRFRQVTKQHGCVEVGNDEWPERKPYKPSPVAPDIARAWDELAKR